MTEAQWKERIPHTIVHHRLTERHAGASMLRELQWQYADMANGGDGGALASEANSEDTCRANYYPGYPDEFFQEVCDLMCWER
ncbi:MAG TPA: hypothetical protein EYG51_08160 [Pseudomonadales bacterium]|nr:hypothetical protein [Pseudomonadales bacterium]